MATASIHGGLVAVICVEAFLFVCCVIAIIVVMYGYFKRKRRKTTSLRPWPYVLPLYWYLSYYDSMVDNCFRVEPRLKLFQNIPNPPEKVKPLVKLFAELEEELQSELSPERTAKGTAQSPVQTRIAEEQAVYPERIAQLYDLDEMVKHYHELEELYTGLESGGVDEEQFQDETCDVNKDEAVDVHKDEAVDVHKEETVDVDNDETVDVDEGVTGDSATGDIGDIDSGRVISAHRVIPKQLKSKSAVLLKEIKLSLDALLTEEDTDKRVCIDIECSAHNENDAWCKARCFEEHEAGTLTKTKDKRRRTRERCRKRKKHYRLRRFHSRKKRNNNIVLL